VQPVLSHYQSLAGNYSQGANLHAFERHRLECLALLKHCSLVLDAGCGTAHLLAELRSELNVLGVDGSPAMLCNGPGTGFVAAAVTEHLPFPDGAFDGVICINVLEHVVEPVLTLRELARVLRPQGRLALSTPAAEWSILLDLAERLHLKLPEGPHRFLKSEELLRVTCEVGLRPEVYRRILLFPIGGRRLARATRRIEQWIHGHGFQHWLIAQRP
jgi:SAM-dependent methyltransferase